jgi:hypothetical protein
MEGVMAEEGKKIGDTETGEGKVFKGSKVEGKKGAGSGEEPEDKERDELVAELVGMGINPPDKANKTELKKLLSDAKQKAAAKAKRDEKKEKVDLLKKLIAEDKKLTKAEDDSNFIDGTIVSNRRTRRKKIQSLEDDLKP